MKTIITQANQNIMLARINSGMSRIEFAEKCGVGLSVVANIESGAAISQRSAAKVAKALNARVEDIFEITTK